MNETKQDDGGPAFPFQCQGATTGPEFYYGMTLRDYFAAAAITGIMSADAHGEDAFIYHSETDAAATIAYRVADSMLKARAAK